MAKKKKIKPNQTKESKKQKNDSTKEWSKEEMDDARPLPLPEVLEEKENQEKD